MNLERALEAEVPPVAVSTSVSTSRECLACGYDIKSQPVDGVCPECGAAIARTLDHKLLRDYEPEQLSRARLGAILVIVSIWGEVLCWVSFMVLVNVTNVARNQAFIDVVIPCVFVAGFFPLVVGARLLTGSESVPARVRWTTRLCAIGFFLGFLGLFVPVIFRTSLRGEWADVVSWWLLGTICVTGMGLARTLGALAPAIGSHATIGRAKRLRWFCDGQAMLIVLPMMALLTASTRVPAIRDWLFRVDSKLFAMGVAQGLIVLSFLAWIVLVPFAMLRFTFAVKHEQKRAAASLANAPLPVR